MSDRARTLGEEPNFLGDVLRVEAFMKRQFVVLIAAIEAQGFHPAVATIAAAAQLGSMIVAASSEDAEKALRNSCVDLMDAQIKDGRGILRQSQVREMGAAGSA